MSGEFHVYILANVRGERPVLYIGVTNNIVRRVAEHRIRPTGFVGKYHVTTLVHIERTTDVGGAIAREKQLKGWTRAKKIALIEAVNPTWSDLTAIVGSEGHAERSDDSANGPSGDPSLRSG